MNHASSLSQCPFYEVKETKHTGRSIFAKTNIPAHTLLLETSHIAAQVIHRSYRREVCSYCFAYQQGRHLPIRTPGVGLVFCTAQCETTFRDAVGPHGIDAFKAVEELLLLQQKRKRHGDADEDVVMGMSPARPSADEIRHAWDRAEALAVQIRLARTAEKPTKQARVAMRDVLAGMCDPSVISYVLSGLLDLSRPSSTTPDGEDGAKAPEKRFVHLKQLQASETPYPTHANLADYTTAYCQLLARVPMETLALVVGELVREIVARTAKNAFDVRSIDHDASVTTALAGQEKAEIESPGSEVLGLALWPVASFFNHSCAPNVRKKRDGRAWQFWTSRDVKQGEELCITYMGGDEEDLSVMERRERLRDGWGFHCQCEKCLEGL